MALGPDETEESGVTLARLLMAELGIRPADLIAEAYVDLLIRGIPNTDPETRDR